MDWTDINWIKPLILPPGALLLLVLGGLIGGGRRGRVLALAAAAGLAVCGMPATDRLLNVALDRMVPAAPPGLVPSAIVVLSGDYRTVAPEYGHPTIGPSTLARLRHAAHLHRRSGLPILASGGGSPPGLQPDMGEAMRLSLEQDFAVPVRWVEGRSRNTLENAVESARILRAEGIDAVLLVTHASHMARAARVFAAAGLRVVPAPAGGGDGLAIPAPRDLLPTAGALARSSDAVHELLGLVWYAAVIQVRGGATR